MTSKTIFRVGLALFVFVGLLAVPGFAAEPETGAAAAPEAAAPAGQWKPIVAIGAGLVTLGAAFGIGRLASSAMEGTARQPEAAGEIRTSMIIAAALIEGFTLFALVVCLLLAL